MSYQISDLCVSCHACMDACPTKAIAQGESRFVIDSRACSHCDGDYAVSQCASICPVEGAILDPFGEVVNPPGSLTGIPPERIAALVAEGIL
ncbi:4Fe-4S dicluster domain-containing protein [Cohaesibacter sp. CAU 1516]|uniref:4Fe-4S binding protein n=1 Tax=Cohaesibacter sp. CAU 1516 TaxID=2576038 RepID=UPI0010FEB32F|nr:4Fe-4S binding protein [Cohaesibacter sp. CAU 1516]TLP44264.1 4Fe-4S dicluster domain-containing protein [Cohaesibacter sp. CAU 1516]